MVWLIASHLVAGASALLLGIRLGHRSRGAVRRRAALRWAFERARSDAERARAQEASLRAELERAVAREGAARDEAEDTRALAASLEAEMVAARWEKEELEQRSRAAREDLERADLVRRSAAAEERAHAALAQGDGVELIVFAGGGATRGTIRATATALALCP